jgi:hypothetical protein
MLDTSTRACIAAATAYIRLWKLAESSDLLVTEDQFSPDALLSSAGDACDRRHHCVKNPVESTPSSGKEVKK